MSEKLKTESSTPLSTEAQAALDRLSAVYGKSKPKKDGKNSGQDRHNVEAPKGGWATVNPEATEPGKNPMLMPYVDERVAENTGNSAKKSNDKLDSLEGLVTVGAGTAHVPKGSGRRSGQFISDQNVDALYNFQDEIRGGLTERQKENERFAQAKANGTAFEATEEATVPDVSALGSAETATVPDVNDLGSADIATVPDVSALGTDAEDTDADTATVPDAGLLGTPDTDNAANISPELADKLTELNDARAKWATFSTARQNRAFERRIKGYNAARDEYNALVQEVGRTKLRSLIEDAGDDQGLKNLTVVSYLVQEQNLLRSEIKHESDNKFINKFANFMNRGSRKARLAKGIVLGLVIGTGGSFLLGAAGAAGAAGLAVGASRFVRGYTSRHSSGINQLDVNAITSDATSRIDNADTSSSAFEQSSAIFKDYFETDSKKEQRKRRTALAIGAASVAAGAIAGHFIGELVHNYTGGGTANAQGAGVNHQPSGTTGGGTEHATSGGVSQPSGHDLLNLHDSYSVQKGEGWYQTFKDMGIPKEQWQHVLQDSGPKLQGQGWSYFDSAHNEWRISHPGQLSDQAMQTIKNSSAKFGYTFR